jgi:hypothetical protein
MFFHIHHRWINPLWRSIKFVMDEELIVQSIWTHLLYFAYVAWYIMLVPHVRFAPKKLFWLPKYNIMPSWWPTRHIGVRLAHMSTQLGTKLKMVQKRGLNPRPYGHWKPLPLDYYFSFVVVRVIVSLYYALGYWFSPTSMVVSPTSADPHPAPLPRGPTTPAPPPHGPATSTPIGAQIID